MGAEGMRLTVRNRIAVAPFGEESRSRRRPGLLGISVVDRGKSRSSPKPPVAAFVWGGKVAPPPTLPFGRWKSAV